MENVRLMLQDPSQFCGSWRQEDTNPCFGGEKFAFREHFWDSDLKPPIKSRHKRANNRHIDLGFMVVQWLLTAFFNEPEGWISVYSRLMFAVSRSLQCPADYFQMYIWMQFIDEAANFPFGQCLECFFLFHFILYDILHTPTLHHLPAHTLISISALSGIYLSTLITPGFRHRIWNRAWIILLREDICLAELFIEISETTHYQRFPSLIIYCGGEIGLFMDKHETGSHAGSWWW